MIAAVESKMEIISRVYSEDLGVRIVMGSGFATDGKMPISVRNRTQADPWVRFLTEMGVYHETGHVKFTDFPAFRKLAKNAVKKSIFNAVEDVRVEKAMQGVWPGLARKWAEFLSEFTRRRSNQSMADPNVPVLWKVTAALYAKAREMQLGKDLGVVLPAEVEDLFRKRLQKFVRPVAEAGTQKQVMKLTERIYRELKDMKPEEPKGGQGGESGKKEKQTGENSGEASDSKSGDNGEKEKKSGESDSPDQGDRDRNEPEESTSDEGEPAKGSEDSDKPEEDGGNEGAESAKGPEDSNKPDDNAGAADAGAEGPEQEPGEEDPQDSDGAGDDESGSEDEAEASDSDADGDGDKQEASDPEDDEDSVQPDAEDPKGEESDDEESGEEDGSEGQEPEDDEDEPEESDGDAEESEERPLDSAELTEEEKALKKEMKSGDGVDSMGDEISKQVNSYVETHKIYRERTGLVDRVVEQGETVDWNQKVSDYEKNGQKITGYQGARLRTLFVSERAPKWQTCQRSGKLDMRKLWNERSDAIFRRKSEAVLQDSAVSLVIDNSHSMLNEGKAYTASSILTAMGSELDHLRIPFEACGFTSDENMGAEPTMGVRTEPIIINLIKRFDEPYRRARHKFVWPRYSNLTVELPCIRFAAWRLAQRKETKKVLFILTDGDTCSGNYDLDTALKRATKEYIERLTRAGMKVVGFGIEDENIAEYCPDHILVKDVNKFASEFYGKLSKILLS